MQFIRKTLVGAMASVLLTLLITFGLAFGLVRVFSTPHAIKTALKDSGIYQTAVSSALDQAQKDQNKQGDGNKEDVPFDNADVQNLIQKAAPPEYLESQANKTLDAVYAWLQGKSPKLEFAVDTQDLKARLATNIEQYTKEHLASLPVCTTGSVNTDVDPFNATCVPKGTDINAVATKAKDNIAGDDFLKNTKLDADSIKVDNDTQTLAQKLQDAPKIYKGIIQAVYALGVLIVLFGVAVAFLSETRRSGFKKLSILGIISGSIVALLGWALAFGVERVSTKISQTNAAEKSGLHVAQLLLNDLRGWWIGYGVFLIILGVSALVALHFVKRKNQSDKTEGPAVIKAAPTSPTPEPQKATAINKPRPRPSKRLVQ